jgi:hypothetical protein
MLSMGKTVYQIRGKATSIICNEVEKQGIFDFVGYGGPAYGQHGAFVELRRGKFEATLRREGFPSSHGYNATTTNSPDPNSDSPTRITFLSISKGSRHFGTYDPEELIRSPRHNFEKDAEKDPELKKFLEDILDNFNKV